MEGVGDIQGHEMETTRDYAKELYFSVAYNDIGQLKSALESGGNPNAFYDDCGIGSGKALLHMACEKGRYECVDILFDYGADVDVRDKWGLTPLMFCMITHYSEIAELILTRHPDAWCSYDMYGKTALHCAVESGNIESVSVLLRHGANTNVANVNGITPLMSMCTQSVEYVPMADQITIVDMLLNEDADVDTIDIGCKRTALQLACVKRKIPLVERLLASGANPNTLDSAGRSPLTNAMWTNVRITETNKEIDPDVMTIIVQLLQAGADINIHKCENSNPLTVACFLRAERLVRFYLEWGADPNVTFISRVTPLLMSVSKKDTASVKTLLNWNSRMDMKGRVCRKKLEEHNWDAMELAIDLACWDIVFMMASAGYNLSSLDYIVYGDIDINTPKSLIDNPEMLSILHDISITPRELFQLSVLAVWKAIRSNISLNISELPLPPSIRRMITLGGFLMC